MNKRVTILDVAKRSGFGVGTVSRVLSGDKYVKESTRIKVMEAVEELQYTPNVNGGRLRRKHSGVIAVLVPIINHPFFAEFVEEVGAVAMQEGYSLLLITSKRNVDKEKEILKKIKQKEIDGAIFVTHYRHSEEELRGFPLVSIDRHLTDSMPFVSSDNYDATRKAVEYLIATGAKNIAYLGTKPHVDSEVILREKAYLDVIKENNLTPYVINEVVEHGEEEKLVDKLLDTFKNIDAIFASGMTLSQILYHKLNEKGFKIPEDIQLISYDGVFNPWNKEVVMTSIKQPIKQLATEAFKILVKLINEEEVQIENIYKTEFIKTKTTK